METVYPNFRFCFLGKWKPQVAIYLLALSGNNTDLCKKGKMCKELAYVISFAPYYWRAMQCGRRWFDESDPKQFAKLGKYVSAMIAAGARLTYICPATGTWPAVISTIQKA